MDEKILKDMIKEQKEIIKRAEAQLNHLYSVAKNMNIKIETGSNPAKQYIEEQREQIMKKVNEVREKAISQAQSIMNGIPNNLGTTKMPKIPNVMGNSPIMPNTREFDIEEIKNEFENIMKQNNGDLPEEFMKNMRRKLNGEKE